MGQLIRLPSIDISPVGVAVGGNMTNHALASTVYPKEVHVALFIFYWADQVTWPCVTSREMSAI